MLYHTSLISPVIGSNQGPGDLLRTLEHSPLAIIYAGSQSVILFFVLSGFVLSLPFERADREGRLGYRAFLASRLCRLYLPYATAVLLAVPLVAAWHGHDVAALGGWFNGQWKLVPTGSLLVSHAEMLGDFPANALDPVLWSLVHEMRISLVFPLLLLLARGRGVLLTGALCAGLLIGGFEFQQLYRQIGMDSYGSTIAYASAFVLGIALARRRVAIRAGFERAPTLVRILALVVGVLLFTFSLWVVPTPLTGIWAEALQTGTAMLGAGLLIVVAQGSRRARRVLGVAPLQLAGRLSYSLYLVHGLVLLALAHLLWGHLPGALVIAMVWSGAFLAAAALRACVELPAQRAGRKLAALVQRPLPWPGPRPRLSLRVPPS
jgi:peptidoglycan/LPS O-acetylase OafA/YrhL